MDPVVHYIPHAAFVDLAWSRGDASLARHHACRVTEIAEQSAIPYLHVYALACTGLAKGIAGEFAPAACDLTNALDFARRSKVGLEFEARMLADLAECHFYGGKLDQALAAAREAIAIAQRRTARCAECHASIISASILANQEGANDEAESLLERAEHIVKSSGAQIYEPLLERGRARLLVRRNELAAHQ
jgi:adenylate cyclase